MYLWHHYDYDDFNRIFKHTLSSKTAVNATGLSPRMLADYRYGRMMYFNDDSTSRAIFKVPSYLDFKPIEDIVNHRDVNQNVTKKIYEKLAILDSSSTYKVPKFVERAFYYDMKGRIIQTVEKNHLNGISRYSMKYNLVGDKLVTMESIRAW